jgi:hypothetical protein
MKSITIDELKKLCEEYDSTFSSYPEHQYEGMEVFEFICKKLDSGKCPKCGEDMLVEAKEGDKNGYKYDITYKWIHYGMIDECEDNKK